LAIEESNTSINVASVTVIATIHGLIRGRHGWSMVGFGFVGRTSDCSALGSSSVVEAMQFFNSIVVSVVGIQSFLPAPASL